MKTLETLKKVFLGEMLSMVGLMTFALAMNDWDFEYVLFDAQSWLVVVCVLLITMIGTYIGYILYKGIKADVMEIKNVMKKRKESKAKTMKSEYAQKIEAMYS